MPLNSTILTYLQINVIGFFSTSQLCWQPFFSSYSTAQSILNALSSLPVSHMSNILLGGYFCYLIHIFPHFMRSYQSQLILQYVVVILLHL